MGGSCKLFSNRSQAARITSETAATAAAISKREGARWTLQESQAKLGVSAPADGQLRAADGQPPRGLVAAAAPAPGAGAFAPGPRSVNGRML